MSASEFFYAWDDQPVALTLSLRPWIPQNRHLTENRTCKETVIKIILNVKIDSLCRWEINLVNQRDDQASVELDLWKTGSVENIISAGNL